MNEKQKWVKEEGKWFYYKSSEKLRSTWIKSNDRWYYLDKDGSMVKGWFQTTKDNSWYYAFSEETINEGKKFYEGEICTGWLKLKEKWYYFEDHDENTLGKMYCDGVFKINNRNMKFDCSGVWIEEINFNAGIIALEISALWNNIKNGIRNKDIITENFLRWVKDSKGNVLHGLVRRRRAEAVLFLDGSIF